MLLSYRILHGLHILFDIRYAVGSVGFTEFDNGRTHDDAVGLGDHFLGLLWVGDSEAYGTWDVFLGFDEFHHGSDVCGDLASHAGNSEGGYAVDKSFCLFCDHGDSLVGGRCD